VSLTHLTIQCNGPCVTVTGGYIWSILREFGQLEELWFEFCAEDIALGRCRELNLGKEGRCERLRRVGIGGVEVAEGDVERLQEGCPCLEVMEINGETRFFTI